MKFALAFLAAAFLIPSGNSDVAPVSSGVVLQIIKEKGAHEAFENLWRTHAWEKTTVGIASGDAKWLEVAQQLFPAADAGAASELLDAVAWALPKAPENVLSMIGADQANWQTICSGPSSDAPPAGFKAYFRDAIAAVRNVRVERLERIRAVCLPLLEAAASAPMPN